MNLFKASIVFAVVIQPLSAFAGYQWASLCVSSGGAVVEIITRGYAGSGTDQRSLEGPLYTCLNSECKKLVVGLGNNLSDRLGDFIPVESERFGEIMKADMTGENGLRVYSLATKKGSIQMLCSGEQMESELPTPTPDQIKQLEQLGRGY